MAAFFDEKEVKRYLGQMSEEDRENYTNGLVDILGLPSGMKQGNKNLDTAFANLGIAITFALTTQLKEKEAEKINEYLSPIRKSL